MARVLIVDDAAFMRLSIRTMLEKNGFEVIGEARNGLEAVQKYRDLNPDIVTMDITMPKVTGVDALKIIMGYDPDAKVIMLSAMGQESMVKEAVLNGAKSFIVKPFKEEHLVKTLRNLIT
ncbi:MAG: response regulator [Candidatus Alkaliphilus sp. MAG34]|nr:response regulator [Clostridiales bacterium]